MCDPAGVSGSLDDREILENPHHQSINGIICVNETMPDNLGNQRNRVLALRSVGLSMTEKYWKIRTINQWDNFR